MLLASTTAFAQGLQEAGPNWEWIAIAAAGILMTVVGAYLKGQGVRIDRIEKDVAETRAMMLKDYQNKADTERAINNMLAVVRAEMGSLGKSVDAVHARLDRMDVPHSG